jgi:predicted ABC-type exoprotein transport system permease subunit
MTELEYKERKLKYMKQRQRFNKKSVDQSFALLGVLILVLIGIVIYIQFIF